MAVNHPFDDARAPRRRRDRWLQHEDLNFVLTNRVPRAALTHLVGWFSRIDSEWLARLSIAVWRQFTELDLSDARETRFRSLHACFTRALKPGARTVDTDPRVLASPCDAIVGACGTVRDGQLFQAKGMPYTLGDLFAGSPLAAHYRDGTWATLRLTSAMYHRFHAPHDGRLEHVTYVSGEVFNVNPVALKRIPRLFCRNERALLKTTIAGGHVVTLVPVAAILVASIRLHALDVRLHLKYRGPNEIACDVPFAKGDELGWFEHGSTILVFAPRGFTLAPGIVPGARIRMGQALMRLP
ncbi:archaetidylserine decarboxylase [Azohydromonas sediminis]|uniref:archaetidylserine decarboxylase n=1 Tax=Azohydromonas sediminis TaxID=2259674 RepID=UPI000E64C5BC|nr:archaetidylserine decarboxylase [Azohydromonas sediminis]